jgi:membrane protein DedA with SNARE-associated domain
VRNLVIGTLVAMVAANWLGAIFLSVLVRDHPLAFIGLNAQNRNLALASGELSAGSFYVVGFLRLLAPDPLFFLLGRWYGDGAIRWMERKAPAYGQILRQLEGWFEKARYVVVAFAPNNPVSLFAGASSMSFGAFMAANVVGTVARLWLIRAFSSAFEGPLGSLKDFIGEYRWPILVLSVVGVGISIWADHRNGRGAIGDLTHIEDEIDEIEASEAGEAGTTEPDATA